MKHTPQNTSLMIQGCVSSPMIQGCVTSHDARRFVSVSRTHLFGWFLAVAGKRSAIAEQRNTHNDKAKGHETTSQKDIKLATKLASHSVRHFHCFPFKI